MPSRDHGKPYLAFDLGAESGRAVLAHCRSGVLTIEEVHRFANIPITRDGSLHWDVDKLWVEMRKALAGLDKVELESIGVDAWGVDYALLGERGELIQKPYHYRDRRTEGVMDEVFRKVPRQEIYQETGVQFMLINTLYQLLAARRDAPEIFSSVRQLITIPDLFHYWLSGSAVCEFTNATTTQMVNPVTRTWARSLIQRLDLPIGLLSPLVEPGSILGTLLPAVAGNSSLADTKIIAPACHDTGSAVAAISARDGTAFISSGTWSLVGTELDAPVITPETLRLNFTNEGGVNGTTRVLKNVMGLWILQCCRQCWSGQGHNFGYGEMIGMAERVPAFRHLIDPDDDSFLRPADMLSAVNEFCTRTKQPNPTEPAAYVRTIFESLAFKYRLVLGNLEQVTGKRIHQIRIIGGGSKNHLLNQLTADATGRRVIAGPAEATALGNIAIQILATGGASSLQEVRDLVDRSFPTEIFEPVATDQWDEHAERFEQYCGNVYA